MKKALFYLLILGLTFFFFISLVNYFQLLKYHFFIKHESISKSNLSKNLLISAASIYDSFIMTNASISSWIYKKKEKVLESNKKVLENNIRRINLKVSNNSIKEMASNLPKSTKKKYYQAELLYPDGIWRKIEYRFRGRSIWHWDPNKPSLRLKLRKKYPINIKRHINLINPEDPTQIANYYASIIATKLNVLSRKYEFVKLYINNSYYGLYHYISRQDESMLRLNNRIPGPIYIGDFLNNKWRAKDFEIRGDLDIHKKLNPLENTIKLLYSKKISSYNKLWQYLNKEKLANWMALMAISGGIHSDGSHNQTFYFDPSTGKIEPIINDVLGLGTLLYPGAKDRLSKKYVPDYKLSINERLTPITDKVLKDPYFYQLRNEKIYKSLKDTMSTKQQKKLLSEIYNKIEEAIFTDTKKSFVMEMFVGFYRIPLSNKRFKSEKRNIYKWIELRNNFLLDQLERSNVEVLFTNKDINISQFLISVNGHSSVDFNSQEFKDNELKAFYNLNNESEIVDYDILKLYPGLKKDLNYYYEQTKAHREPLYYLFPDKQYYLFEVDKMSLSDFENKIKKSFKNSLSKKNIIPKIKKTSNMILNNFSYNKVSMHPWNLKKPKILNELVLGPGEIQLNKNLISLPNQQIKILPGTTLLMFKDVSIISQGKLILKGDKDKPIIIKSLDPSRPWGVIGAIGKFSDGSVLENCQISGGSKSYLLNIFFTGMISFNWSDRLKINNCYFANNYSGDDTLRVINSNKVELNKIFFENCFGDCLDFDYVKGKLNNIKIYNSGNDGLDFMGSVSDLKNIKIEKFTDKGISVGEKSKLKIANTLLVNGNIGIAVKDDSIVELNDSEIKNNNFGIDIYKKNWRFSDSGHITINKSLINNNGIDLRTTNLKSFENNFSKINNVVID